MKKFLWPIIVLGVVVIIGATVLIAGPANEIAATRQLARLDLVFDGVHEPPYQPLSIFNRDRLGGVSVHTGKANFKEIADTSRQELLASGYHEIPTPEGIAFENASHETYLITPTRAVQPTGGTLRNDRDKGWVTIRHDWPSAAMMSFSLHFGSSPAPAPTRPPGITMPP